MYNEVVRNNSYALRHVPDHFKTQQMCERTVEIVSWSLAYVPDHFKTQQMCERAVEKDLCLPEYVPNWFVTQGQIKSWHDDDEYCNDNRMIEWFDSYKKRKAQKASIKEELLPIAWHPSRYWDWCMSENEKKETEKLWA